MRIQFVSDERPTRVAKSLKKRLAELGHDLPFSTVREATASMYGYRNWNDLRAQLGSTTSSPYDQDAGPGVADLRAATFAERLSASLSIPMDIATSAIAEVGPTSRRQPPATIYDFDADTARIAGFFAEDWTVSPHPQGRAGFLASSSRTFRGIKLEKDGSIHVEDGGKVVEEGLSLSNVLIRSRAKPGQEPQPAVLDFLRRLDPKALRLLRSVRRVDLETYEIARSVPEDSAWARLVDRLPLLGSEMATLGHDRTSGFEKEPDSLRERMIVSQDPMEDYLSIVENYALKEWPAAGFDRESARRVVERIGTMVTCHDLGLLPWHTAFLSYAPDAKLPGTAKALEEAFGFIERWTVLFDPLIGMAPDDFYREFDGDWKTLDERCYDLRTSMTMRFSPIACVLTRSAADALGRPMGGNPWELEEDPVAGILEERIREAVVKGKGLASLARTLEALRLEEDDDVDEEARTNEDRLQALLRSRAIHEQLVDGDAVAALGRFGIDPVAYLDSIGGKDEETLRDIERRISTDGEARSPWTGVIGTETFHSASIKGVTFTGSLYGGGLCLEAFKDGRKLGSTDLGWSAKIAMQADGEWAVCKYDESRIPLEGFSAADVLALNAEFGIHSMQMAHAIPLGSTPAGIALREYAARHPIKAGLAAKRYPDIAPLLGLDMPEPETELAPTP